MGTAGLSRRPMDPEIARDCLMSLGLVLLIVLGCGVLALLYGAWAIRSVLSRSAGNARMQEIATAIQEGASAYLRRQYLTITVAGFVVLAISLGVFGWHVALAYLIGAVLSGAAGF